MRQNGRHGLWQAFIALVVTSLATLLAPLSAMAESSIVGAEQAAAAGEDAAPESLRANNGFDLTRPQTAFEVRGLDETSSNDTSETNRAQMALRLESMIPLDVHVCDLASAHVKALDRVLAGGENASVNLGTGRGHSIRDVICA